MPNPHLDNLRAALAKDPKKAAVLGLLTAVLAVMGLRPWLKSVGGPAAASAVPTNLGLVAAADGSILRIPSLRHLSTQVQEWSEQPTPHLARNLFKSDLLAAAPRKVEAVPPPAAAPVPIVGPEDGAFWRQLELALATQGERQQFRRHLEQDALADAAPLVLTSVFLGDETRALINDKSLAADAWIAAANGPFLVEKVEPRRVVLRRDGVRVELMLGRAAPKLTDE